ncbi:hypothetical protein ABIE65_002031 [Constrictibacter sp. MBR-5]|jgi:hypothetical protein|uniref:hypothetical protein n=1 Tax=Constrictibacter sp. MBR-5 TaxID=3156467 RepID=UPI003392B935
MNMKINGLEITSISASYQADKENGFSFSIDNKVPAKQRNAFINDVEFLRGRMQASSKGNCFDMLEKFIECFILYEKGVTTDTTTHIKMVTMATALLWYMVDNGYITQDENNGIQFGALSTNPENGKVRIHVIRPGNHSPAEIERVQNEMETTAYMKKWSRESS